MKRKSRGAAMALVIAAMMMIIALGTAALVAANAAYATSVDNAVQQQAYLAATSYCDVLRAKLTNSGEALTQRVDALSDGDTMMLTANAEGAGELGTAECTLALSGNTLKVTVNAFYADENCTVKMQLKKTGGSWVFDSYLPVD